ncbi:MAG TPA: class I SAM-dependent DNA methyltransferase [Methanofastidiosum sp.]|mgnify:FL=1|jgi:type I restriction enzyme M protein|nr:SAM-dependent DNA methyltransferase [Methanofastidiosum sp.]HNZ61219.1 class I SAM-dependent DNA methyltransferase [Methanofastidiosum sp.]HOE92698.1 class I SAM-dependent DNA methyltransferase [Methanofastidiosum sp.]HOR88265.1 class I SAM-dependent DNA methyltransferase [Methanofastidiosum sp.]HPL00471.1 class I SAM-dependent DNA methyltransferase [Methanofastidiosum sp.]
MSNESMAVQKLWNYCNVLRDDGVSYGDYVEQLTYLLFLKMDDEQTKPPFNRLSKIPKNLNWESLLKKDGDELEVHYRHILGSLGKEKGMIGVIFRKAQNKIQDPAKLKRLVMLIEGEETWMGMGIDVKGAIYEGLLQKNAEDTKSGAGQYFTPRALIKSMVKVIRPKPGETICDPACGTGGFLLASHDLISKYPLDVEQKQFLREGTFHGWDIVDSVVRLCTMNLYLHGIGGEESPIITDDALASDPGNRFDIVLTNPPFGKKSSITIVNGEGKIEKESLTYQRNDFWATTSNKQLNFLQHVKTLLKINGRAAIVVPDNVLFEGGAGETVRKRLLQQCEVHTLLRLPTGIFYAQGVKANVLFFDKRPASEKPWTEKLWIYDLRTNLHFTLKTNTLQYEDLKDFIKCYNPENRHERKETDRFKAFTYEDIIKRDKTNLDIFWLKDESLGDSENLPNPKILALEIAEDLESALEEFKRIYEVLEE